MSRGSRLAATALRAVTAGLLLALLCRQAVGQTLELHLPAHVSDPDTPRVMRDLAARIIPNYYDADRRRYLATLSVLQDVAGSWSAAYAARLSLAELDHRSPADVARTPDAVYDLHVRARALQAQEHVPYAQVLARSFESLSASLDDLSAYHLGRWLRVSPAPLEEALARDFERQRARAATQGDRVSVDDALGLIEDYAMLDAQRSIAPLAGELVAADEQRRYVIEELHVPVAPGTTVGAVLARSRAAAGPLPGLLTLTLEPAREEAIAHAAHGYIGMAASLRTSQVAGHARARKHAEPFEHEGEDARAVLSWLATQGFSDGRVALWGEGYGAFAAWSAARRPPAALRALVVASAMAPGIDMPMEGSIFRNEAYRWLLHVTGEQGGDDEAYRDDARWRTLDALWFESGRPYRDLDHLYGVPSPIFQRWLAHPSFDEYWRRRLPRARELASLAIPVLTLTGYYDAGEAGALYYFGQHRRAGEHAEHILLLGPYDQEALRSAPTMLRGYSLDAAARIDLLELRYQWLDHVLRTAPRPAVLAGDVNYEVMGADAWRHMAQLPGTASALRLYLDSGAAQGERLLLRRRPAGHTCAPLTVDLGNRSPVSFDLDPPILTRSLRWRDALLFVSEPLPASVELAGHPVLQLWLASSNLDVDLTATLYEQLPDGQYLLLYAPPYEQRASYAGDRRVRRLLTPGHVQPLILSSPRVLGRSTVAGSRLVLLLGVKKRPDEQINHGSGGDVSRESSTDARRPLRLRLCSGSRLEIPVGP
jgi:putative CocE/NonD family hydrolase